MSQVYFVFVFVFVFGQKQPTEAELPKAKPANSVLIAVPGGALVQDSAVPGQSQRCIRVRAREAELWAYPDDLADIPRLVEALEIASQMQAPGFK